MGEYERLREQKEMILRASAEKIWAHLEHLLIEECGLRRDEGLTAQRLNLINAIIQGLRDH